MPAARYWRVLGLSTQARGANLSLSALHLHDASGRVDQLATLSSSAAPQSGAVASLQDADFTTECAWAGPVSREPGFALVWDFGGSTKAIKEVRAGSTLVQAEFADTVTLQYSTDGIYWTTWWSGGFAWPGARAAASVTVDAIWDTAVADPYASRVAVLCHFETAPGGEVQDQSPAPAYPGYLLGSSAISSAASRSGTNSCYFASSASWVGWGVSDPTNFGRGDFHFEISVQSLGLGTARVIAANCSNSQFGWRIYCDASNAIVYENWTALGTVQLKSGSVLAYGAWTDIVVERCEGFVRLWIGSDLVDVAEDATDMAALNVLILGWQHTGVGMVPWYGYMDRMRIGKFARYAGGALSPATRRALAPAVLHPMHQQDIGPLQVRELDGLTHLVDTEFGGRMTLAGTTKFKGVSTNYPIYARVNVLSERDKRLVAQVWSDPTTGAWSVPWLDEHQQFLALAQDPTGNYRAVAADRLVPEAAA